MGDLGKACGRRLGFMNGLGDICWRCRDPVPEGDLSGDGGESTVTRGGDRGSESEVMEAGRCSMAELRR